MQRREAANRDGDLHALGKETFRIWDQMRVNQESFDDRCAFLVGVLRQILCFGREWKYLCERCDDYGLVLATCDGSSACGRPRQHLPHTYGTPCVCSRGRQFEKAKPVHAEDYTQAGKTRKTQPKGWSMGGR
jgi:hypothetical protein